MLASLLLNKSMFHHLKKSQAFEHLDPLKNSHTSHPQSFTILYIGITSSWTWKTQSNLRTSSVQPVVPEASGWLVIL